MSERLPKIGSLSIPGRSQVQLEELVSNITVDYNLQQLAELQLTINDPNHLIAKSPLAAIGSRISFEGESWTVASIESNAFEWGSRIVVKARDPLARALRLKYKTSAEKQVSPGDWVKRRVKSAGGVATVQPSSKRGTVSQSKTQSVLDVINTFAGDLDWSWTSHGGRFYFASRHYVWVGKLATPTWSFTWDSNEATDVLASEWNESGDNTENRAELTIRVPYEAGKNVRPFHRITTTIPGATGTWLVEGVSIVHDLVSPVEITATKPNKPSPKAGSSSKGQ